MFISLLRTYFQNFSNWHALFVVVVVFFITFCSRCGMVWDTACRPTDDPFWAFLSPGAQEPAETQTIFVHFRKLKKIYIYFGHSSTKDNHPGFVLPQKFETSWALLGRLSRGFFFSFAISGASNFKHSFAFHEPVLDFGMLMWELPGRVSYFVSSLL